IRCRDLRRVCEGPINAYVKASLKDPASGEGCVKRTAVHRSTPNPIFHETLLLPCPPVNNHNCATRQVSLDIAVWHRDRRARRSELLGCMTLPLPLSQDKEATWHPLEAGRSSSCVTGPFGARDSLVSPPLSTKDGADSITDNNNSGGPGTGSQTGEELTYLRHLELEPLDPLTGLPLHPGFTARGGRTPCTVTRRLVRPAAAPDNQVPWGFSLSWGRPPRVERVDPGSPAERSGLRPGDYVVFVDATNVVTQPRDDILELIQAATSQLVLEVYRRSGVGSVATTTSATATSTTVLGQNRRSSAFVQAGQNAPVSHHHQVTFTAEVVQGSLGNITTPLLPQEANTPEEELSVRESRFWSCLRSGQVRFVQALAENRDILSATDHAVLFQNLEELLKLSEDIRDEGCTPEAYLVRVPNITAAYRRYLSGLQRAFCLLVALRKNSAFAKIVCEPAVPRRKKPDLTGVLIQPLEHYREMTRLLLTACPRNSGPVRDLAHGYREATASAAMMEPPRDSGKPLLSLQEVESRLVFARCKPFTLAHPGRQWLFGGALAKVEGRGRQQSMWALLLTDLLVFARVSRDRVLFVTEEPLKLACIAEACFTIRKRPTEFRLQITTQPSAPGENLAGSTEVVQCAGTSNGTGTGCSPHSRARRRLLILRAPSPELKAVWHNLLQRQIIYVNTNYGCIGGANPVLDSPDDDSPTNPDPYSNAAHQNKQRELASSPEVYRSAQQLTEEPQSQQQHHQHQQQDHHHRPSDSLELMLCKGSSQRQQDNHLAQWVRNSHQIPPPDNEVPIEEWTPEELAARTPKDPAARDLSEGTEESAVINSDAEQQSSTSSASLSTVKSNSLPPKKNGSVVSSRDTSSSSINMCRRCHRSGCPTPPMARDPFSPLPPRIAVLPPTPDLCSRHRFRNGFYDSPGRNSPSRGFSQDGAFEDGSEDDFDCDGEPPYRALRRFGTMSSLDQDDDLDEQLSATTTTTMATAICDENDPRISDHVSAPVAPMNSGGGLRAWTLRASSYVVSKMSILEHIGGDGCQLLQPPVPPERTDASQTLEPNGDDEGSASGATSENDIWGTPTSGGPDDDSLTGSPPGLLSLHPDHYHHHGHQDQLSGDESGDEGELSMEQLLGGIGSCSRPFLVGRGRRLEPLPEEDDSLSIGSGSISGSCSSRTAAVQAHPGWW
ncbi:hypothetical protein QAD02_016189, partial [Eretmocerus hayati]